MIVIIISMNPLANYFVGKGLTVKDSGLIPIIVISSYSIGYFSFWLQQKDKEIHAKQ
ncbi:hypothetical protein GCM10010918_50360 [Paenibacillus radicis (ex Gao et al. 2016)]|uniref:Uncharacterized protein n=1 Tax=Paenibacillus radicis (ex Gao et al. 2016) TaxID=1737354 RepID=A0A917HPA2_9BACL|nr:hypothetical protein GCM10010918_50360 [Paenibacillus radicis (ex Gao et al. 2016)]